MKRVGAQIRTHEADLNELDAILGDGEHGFNLCRAFGLVEDSMRNWADLSLAELLRQTGMTLLSAGGGAGTSFYAVGFLSAARAAPAGQTADVVVVADMLREALDAICQRGKAEPGDKTMVDALAPAVEAFEQAAAQRADLHKAWLRATAAAKAGMERTKDMIGSRGRSLYAGERGRGTPDPGAVSTYLFFEAVGGVPAD